MRICWSSRNRRYIIRVETAPHARYRTYMCCGTVRDNNRSARTHPVAPRWFFYVRYGVRSLLQQFRDSDPYREPYSYASFSLRPRFRGLEFRRPFRQVVQYCSDLQYCTVLYCTVLYSSLPKPGLGRSRRPYSRYLGPTRTRCRLCFGVGRW